MAILNLRNFPDDLMRELKSECGLNGETLVDYCVRVFRQRGSGRFVGPRSMMAKVEVAPSGNGLGRRRTLKTDAVAIPGAKVTIAHEVEAQPVSGIEGPMVNDLLRIPGVAVASDPRYARPSHDSKACRIYKCGMCAAEKGEK